MGSSASTVKEAPEAVEKPVTVEVKATVQRSGEVNPSEASFNVCLNDTKGDLAYGVIHRIMNKIKGSGNNFAEELQELDATDSGPAKNPPSNGNADGQDSNKQGADGLQIAIENVLKELIPHDVEECKNQLMTLGLTTKDQWKEAAKTIFGAAINNKDTGVLRAYVKLCQLLDKNVSIQYSFKKLFSGRCQFEVESGIFKDEDLSLPSNRNNHGSAEGRKYANIARFLCEMCRAGLFSIRTLRKQVEAMFYEDEEEYIACACIISKTIGKDLDAFGIMEDCFAAVKKLLHRDDLSLSTWLLVQEVLELRRNNWSSDHGIANKDDQDAENENLPRRYSYLAFGLTVFYTFFGLGNILWPDCFLDIVLITLTSPELPSLVTGHLHGVTLLMLAYQFWQMRNLEAMKKVLKHYAACQCIHLTILWMYGKQYFELFAAKVFVVLTTMSTFFFDK